MPIGSTAHFSPRGPVRLLGGVTDGVEFSAQPVGLLGQEPAAEIAADHYTKESEYNARRSQDVVTDKEGIRYADADTDAYSH